MRQSSTYRVQVYMSHALLFEFDKVDERDVEKFQSWSEYPTHYTLNGHPTLRFGVMKYQGHYLPRESLCAMVIKKEV